MKFEIYFTFLSQNLNYHKTNFINLIITVQFVTSLTTALQQLLTKAVHFQIMCRHRDHKCIINIANIN